MSYAIPRVDSAWEGLSGAPCGCFPPGSLPSLELQNGGQRGPAAWGLWHSTLQMREPWQGKQRQRAAKGTLSLWLTQNVPLRARLMEWLGKGSAFP